MKLFNQYQIEIAFYNDDELIIPDAPEIPPVRGCVCKITNLDNGQQKLLKVPAFPTFEDRIADREILRELAIEDAKTAINTYERNLHTLRTSKPETDNLD